MNQDELQEFLADNVNADVPVDIQNQMMTDATALDFASFQKKWDKYLQDNSEGWSKLRASTKTTKERVKEAFGNDIPSDNWLFEMHAKELSDIPIEDVRAAIAEIGKEKEAVDEKQKIADEYKREAEARYARQKAVDNYEHQYKLKDLIPFAGPFLPEFGPNMPGPVNTLMNTLGDLVISDKTKRAIVEDPNDAGRIAGNAAVDIVGTGLDFAPGYGYVFAPVVRTGRNIAEYDSEKDKVRDIVKEGAADLIGSLALDKGIKGLPIARDLGPLHKVEEKIPLNEWSAKVKTAKTPVKNVVLELPPADPKEIGKWIEKQPAELRKEFYKVVEENPSNVREALIKKIDELGDIANKDTYKQMVAEQWVKENPVKAKTGMVAEQGTLGTERILAVKPFQAETEYKTSSPKKIKTYDDAISFIIDSNKRQWEAGLKPHDMSGIVGEAYKKWESER